jgi:hypothetical protein
MIPIECADQWEKYVRSAMKSQFQSLDVVVRRVLVDAMPHGFPPPMAQQAYFDPPALAMDAEVPRMVPNPNVLSTLNEVCIAEAVGDASQSHDVVAEPPQEILLTKNHPSKCLFLIVLWSLPPSFHPFISLFPCISYYIVGDIPANVDVPPVDAQVPLGDGFCASNSVDSEPYEIARVVDSDDDRPIGELTESDVEMLRRIFPDRHDPRVHEFSDLTHSDQACAEGRDE